MVMNPRVKLATVPRGLIPLPSEAASKKVVGCSVGQDTLERISPGVPFRLRLVVLHHQVEMVPAVLVGFRRGGPVLHPPPAHTVANEGNKT